MLEQFLPFDQKPEVKPMTLKASEVYFDNANEFDAERLTGQIKRIFELVKDGRWRTLDEIAKATGDPHASISAQLRHLRKKRFGSHTVNKQHRGHKSLGLYEYQLIVNEL